MRIYFPFWKRSSTYAFRNYCCWIWKLKLSYLTVFVSWNWTIENFETSNGIRIFHRRSLLTIHGWNWEIVSEGCNFQRELYIICNRGRSSGDLWSVWNMLQGVGILRVYQGVVDDWVINKRLVRMERARGFCWTWMFNLEWRDGY